VPMRQLASPLHWASGLLLGALLGAAACAPGDAAKELTLSEIETYYVIDQVVGQQTYIAPAVRFRVTNSGTRVRRAIEVTGTFRIVGEKETWGSGWVRVVPPGEVLEPGRSNLVVMISDRRYHSPAPAERMFGHEKFQDVSVEVFARLEGSAWARVAESKIERRVGSHSAERFLRLPTSPATP
jgi:hypothetical protein